MNIFVRGRAFECGVILRTLYYMTGLEGINLFINCDRRDLIFRYSRVPVRILKNIKEFDRAEGFVLDPNAKKSIFDVGEVDSIIIDFFGEADGERIKAIGIKNLLYESIALFYELFVRRKKWEVKGVNQEITKEVLYYAKKILEGITMMDNIKIISPKLLVYVLKQAHKDKGILVDCDEMNFKYNWDGEYEMRLKIKFYNKELEEVGKDEIILRKNVLEVPFFGIGRKIFVIDYDRKRVYIGENEFISEEREEINLKDFIRRFF